MEIQFLHPCKNSSPPSFFFERSMIGYAPVTCMVPPIDYRTCYDLLLPALASLSLSVLCSNYFNFYFLILFSSSAYKTGSSAVANTIKRSNFFLYSLCCVQIALSCLIASAVFFESRSFMAATRAPWACWTYYSASSAFFLSDYCHSRI